jgi:polar amino acid transport system substrate-binding protein
MKRLAYACAMWFACLALDAAALPAAETVSVRTSAQLASAPKFVQQGEGSSKNVAGLCIDINRAIERQDPALRISGDQHSLPLTRIEAQMRTGTLDMACGLLRTRERESLFTYVEPALFTVTYVMVARADDEVVISNWDDVRSLGDHGTILLIHGQGTLGRLKELGGLQIDAGGSDAKTNLQKLLAGRGRFYYHRVPGIATEIRRAALEGKVRVLPTVMDTQRFHMVVGRHVAPATLERLRRALMNLESSGELKRLFEQWYDEAPPMDGGTALVRNGR